MPDDAPFEREPSPPSDWFGAPPIDCPSPSPSPVDGPPSTETRASEPADDHTEDAAVEEPERKRSARDHHPESQRLCQLLMDSLVRRGGRDKPITDAWLTEMDRIIRIDGREPDRVEGFIRWLDAGEHPVAKWWQPNIRSPHKIREQWDQVTEQRDRENRGSARSAQPRSPGAAATSRSWQDSQRLLDRPEFAPDAPPSLRVVGE
jgi:hypothetical protein